MKTKPTVKILICVLAAGSALAQSPSIIQNTRNTMNAVSNNSTAASNEALGINQSSSADANHSSQARTSSANATASAGTSAAKVNAPKSSPAKSSSPKSVSTSPKSKVSVAKVSVAKVSVAKVSVAKVSVAKAPLVAVHAGVKPAASPFGTKPVAAKAAQPVAKTAEASKVATANGSEERGDNDASLPLDSKYAANGRRDPFISPVVSHGGTTSSCSSGKKCLEIGTLNLRGVVHGESGFIAVVSNGLNKAYFLRENDPVFNGYVVKITGDSIIFQETLQDRLGKSFTREITKKIITPAV
jgi:hypothetical protein